MKKYLKYILLVVINIALILCNIYACSKAKSTHNSLKNIKEEIRVASETVKSQKNIYESLKNFGVQDDGSGMDKPDFSYDKPDSGKTSDSGNRPSIPQTGISVCIDAGHGKTSRKVSEPVSPGSSTKKAGNVTGAAGEEEFNLSVALMVKQRLEAAGITVDMTRTTNECDKTNVERAEQANKSDYCIRIHADGSENSSAHGISVLVPEKSYYGDSSFVSESRELAKLILDEAVSNTGAKNVGLITRSDLTGFNWSKVPVVLIECGFLSNPEEKAKLQTPEYRAKLADGIADGFLKYLTSTKKTDRNNNESAV